MTISIAMTRAFVLFLAALVSTLAQSAEPVALRDFARHMQFREVAISPGGDYLAMTALVDGDVALSVIRLSDMKGFNLKPRENGQVEEFWWVSPKRVFYTVAERQDVLEQPVGMGEIHAVNADGTGKKLMVGYRATGEWLSADLIRPVRPIDGKVLIAKYRWNGSRDGVYPVAAAMDIETGSVTDLATAPIRNAEFAADHAGNIRFAAAQGTDQKQRVYHRAVAGGDWTLVFDESKGEPLVDPIGFDRTNAFAYMTCAGQHGKGGLCRWDPASGKLATVWSGMDSGLIGLVSSHDGNDIIAVRSMPGRTATTLLDRNAPEAKLLTDLLGQFPGEDVQITSSTPDGSKVVFLVSSAQNPGQFYLYDRAARKASFLLARAPWIEPSRMAAVEPITVKSRDGLNLHGYLARPPGQESAKSLPMVVYVHGGPYGIRDTWEFAPYLQALASRGYAVLQINFRGSGGYGADFVRAGHREWGAKMQDDVTDATRWAIAQGIAEPARICIFGASYGGYAALQGAVKEPDLYRCAIGYVGVYNLRMMFTRGDIPQSIYGDNYLKMVLGEDEAVQWDRSPVAHLDRLKAKVMVIVGGQDKRVPPVHGEGLRSALNKARIEHEWLYQRTEGHGFYVEKNVENLLQKLVAFLDTHIGAPKTRLPSKG